MPIEIHDHSRDATGPAESIPDTDLGTTTGCIARVIPGRTETGVPGMNKTSRPRRTLPEGISLARLRGKVELTRHTREALYHLTIVAAGMVAFVRVRFAAQILATLPEIEAEFKKDLVRLRAIVQDAAISRELWLRSRYGTWRFFRITETGLVEIDRNGQVFFEAGDPDSGPVTG